MILADNCAVLNDKLVKKLALRPQSGGLLCSYTGDEHVSLDTSWVARIDPQGNVLQPVKLWDTSLIKGDWHGPVALFQLSDGTVHAIGGSHNSVLRWATSTNDGATWTEQAFPFAGTYPEISQDGDRVFLFLRVGTGHASPWKLYEFTGSWQFKQAIFTVASAGNSFYADSLLDGNFMHFAGCWQLPNTLNRQNHYYVRLNLDTGTLHNVEGMPVPSNNVHVEDPRSDYPFCMVGLDISNYGTAHQVNCPQILLSPTGEPETLQVRNDPAWTLEDLQWNGTSWQLIDNWPAAAQLNPDRADYLNGKFRLFNLRNTVQYPGTLPGFRRELHLFYEDDETVSGPVQTIALIENEASYCCCDGEGNLHYVDMTTVDPPSEWEVADDLRVQGDPNIVIERKVQ